MNKQMNNSDVFRPGFAKASSRATGFMRIFMILVGLLWFGAILGRADTHYVSLDGNNTSPYTNGWASAATNIQWAVNASAVNDTVLVSNGTYNLTNEITVTKAITLVSFKGRDDTTLWMDLTWGSNRCISLTTTGTIDGFTIANGYNTNSSPVWFYGGGVYMTAGTIQNCAVVSNRMTVVNYGLGAGISCSGGRVFNCLVTGNSGGGGGGGVYLFNAVMSNCVISSNSASGSAYGGGGVLMQTSSRITDCVISNNASAGPACGLAWDSAGCYASNCIITDNLGPATTLYIGAGNTAEYCVVRNNIFTNMQSAACLLYGTLRNSFIHDNNKKIYDATCAGVMIRAGGIAENCVISNNAGYSYGTGVRMEGGGTLRNCLVIAHTNDGVNSRPFYSRFYPGNNNRVTVENCTIAFNLNGMYLDYVGGTTGTNVVINTIVYSNTTANITEVAGGNVNWFTNCNVGATVSGANNINTNPAWVDPANYNFRLIVGSPCINAGTNQAWMTGATDLDGRRRLDAYSGQVDMGCYEHLPEGTMYKFR